MATNSSRVKTNQNIQVYLRVRPTNERERFIRSQEVVEVPSNKEVVVRPSLDNKLTKKFTFDRTFGPLSKQTDVYHAVVSPLIEEVLAGYNCTVFAYGQTGTGKTHTMIGEETPLIGLSWDDETTVGIIPRAVSQLFDELRMMEVEFSMRISYLELYNEELSDLLSSSDTTLIRIFDDVNKKGSIIVNGLEEIPVHSTNDVYKLLAKGQEKRKTAATLMNTHSSRSHTIFSILVHIRENNELGEELLKIGKLNLVDLAGSENITKAGNERGIRTRETVNINQSLLTLGRVITALVERTPHVPYRESKLTRLLQESLGGRTKTSIIATISPGHKDLEETLSTLDYAHRAKNIQNKPELNSRITKKTVLKDYTEEIDRLKRDLMATRDKNGIYLAEETYNTMQNQLDTQNRELNEKVAMMRALKDEMASKQRLFVEVSTNLVEKTEELHKTTNNLVATQHKLGETKTVLHHTQRKYQEKRHLVKNLTQTENILTQQANELLNVANIASNDTYRLHDTMARRKEIDQHIELTKEKLQQAMQSRFNEMSQTVEQLRASNSKYSNELIQNIYGNSINSEKFTSSTECDIKNILESNQQYQLNVSNCLIEHKKTFDTLSEQQKISVMEMIQSTIMKQHTLNDNVTSKLNNFLTKMNEQNQLICTNNLQIIEQLNNRMVDFNTFCNNQSIYLEKQSNDLQTIINQKSSDILDYTTTTNSLLDRLQDIVNEGRKNTVKINATAKDFTSINQTINSSCSNEIEKINIERASMENDCKQIFGMTRKQCEHIEQYFNDNKNAIGNVQKTMNDANGDFSEQVKVIQNTFNTLINECEQQQIIITNDISTLNAKQCNELQTNAECIKTKISLEKDRSSAANSNDVTTVSTHCNETDQHYGNLVKCLESVNEDLETYAVKELKTYSSTGDTPMKKEFKYPEELVGTSPHARIIRRFWQQNQNVSLSDLDCSTTISEIDEINGDADDQIEDNLSTESPMQDDTMRTLQEITVTSTPNVIMMNNAVGMSKTNQNVIKVPDDGYFLKSNKENM